MGCWGLGLFQSDHDYNVLDYLSDEVGIGLHIPEDPVAVRTILEKDGKLSRMFDEWKASISGASFSRPPKNTIVILGASAMQVGAKIEDRHLELLRTVYKSCGLYEVGER